LSFVPLQLIQWIGADQKEAWFVPILLCFLQFTDIYWDSDQSQIEIRALASAEYGLPGHEEDLSSPG
jgi:hypothetical protein